MKKRLTVCLIFIGLAFYGCKKESLVTNLKIIVNESVGDTLSPLADATVKIYTSQLDAVYDIHVAGTGTTDAGGTVTFSGILPVKHYWRIKKGCLDSGIGSNLVAQSPVVPGQTATIGVWITRRGIAAIKNISSVPYKLMIEVNGYTILQPSKTASFALKEGDHNIKFHPEADTSQLTLSTIHIVCGDTLSFNIP